jgi:hypothetical protein
MPGHPHGPSESRFIALQPDETLAARSPVLKWKKRAPVAEAAE